jgi:hypothetical protein
LAVVAVNELRIRERPGVSKPVVATAGRGEVVHLTGFAGRVVVDGFEWYSVDFAAGYADWPDGPAGNRVHSGWAAAGSAEQRYLELLPPRCPEAEPDLAALTAMTEWEQLACFGDRSLMVASAFGCHTCGYPGIPGTYEPAWLAHPGNINELSTSRNTRPLVLHFRPDAGLEPPPRASIVRVTGHFNDPAANTCVMASGEVDPVSAELYCRERFVVDRYTVLGADPDFLYPPPP